MQTCTFDEVIDRIVARDPRYHREAYHLVREALDFTQQRIHRGKRKPRDRRHVTGQQLLEGLREYVLKLYGPMAHCLLADWGIHRCEDFGEMVFNLVENGNGMFGKTDEDSREDFKGGYDFYEAFRRPYLPASPPPADRPAPQTA